MLERQRTRLKPRVPLAHIDRIVSARLGETRVRGNAQPAAFNRQVAMYLAKHVGGWSTTRIGMFYNGRDHSTVCYAIQRIEALREVDAEVDGLISVLRDAILHCSEQGAAVESATSLGSVSTVTELDERTIEALADKIVLRFHQRGVRIETTEGVTSEESDTRNVMFGYALDGDW